MSCSRRAVALPAATALCWAALATLLVAQSAGAPSGEPVSPRERDLAEIRRQIDRLEEEVSRARDQERTLAQRLEAAELDLDLQERRVAEAAAARELAEERVARAEEEVARLEGELGTARASLRRRLSGLYRLGRHGPLRLILSVEPGADLPAALRLLRFLVRRDARAVGRYVEAREALVAQRQRLEGERREVERWLAEAESRHRQLAAARSRQARLLARARSERRELAARAEDLVDKERKLSNLLDALYGRAPRSLSGTPIQDFRGVLDWPVEGEVTLGFGPRTDPTYRTEVPHNGIEIAPGRPGEVRAVYPGKVLYAAPFEGYGPTVVVHHAGSVFTLYAGLEELRAGRGDVLELGDPVGSASGRIYFEIRRENRPEDPLAWLR
ncbi:MAG: murein hydrolase activator EnvC family protein [Thermoanaerobaculia bacterium]